MNHFSRQKQTIVALTGMKVGHSTQQRLVGRQSLELPDAKQAVAEVSVDGGKVRLRNLKDSESPWRDYKAVRLGGIYYGGFFQDNLALIDYVNSQHLAAPLVCLGDGHDGVWNIFREIATTQERWYILDWYHLKENLYKVGGSLKRLTQAEALLWQGQIDKAKALFADCRRAVPRASLRRISTNTTLGLSIMPTTKPKNSHRLVLERLSLLSSKLTAA